MSKHIPQLIFLTITISAITIYLGTSKTTSLYNAKQKNFYPKNYINLKQTQKLKGPIQVQLINKEKNYEYQPNRPFTLTAIVTSQQDLIGSPFEWKIPNELQHVSGKVEGTVHSENEVASSNFFQYEFQITAQSAASINQKIHFFIHYQNQASQNAQYNTLLEQTLQKEKAALKLNNENYVKKMKVFQ